MKALSVRQPYASLIAAGIKTIECRTWFEHYRGELLIAAARKPDPAGDGLAEKYGIDTPLGVAVCIVTLADCRRFTQDDMAAACVSETKRCYAWVLTDIRPIKPFPVAGKQKIFEVNSQEDIHT